MRDHEEIGVSEAKRRWAELLSRVAAGETIKVTRRGRFVASLVPVNTRATLGERAATAGSVRDPSKRKPRGNRKSRT